MFLLRFKLDGPETKNLYFSEICNRLPLKMEDDSLQYALILTLPEDASSELESGVWIKHSCEVLSSIGLGGFNGIHRAHSRLTIEATLLI